MILINLKIYKETWGDGGIKLAKICKAVADETGVRIVVAANALEAVRVFNETRVETWLQNVDEYSDGKHTGWISIEQAMNAGIKGSLINHFEHQIPRGTAQKIIKNRPQGFGIICCAKSVGQIGEWIVKAKPDYILYEAPEFIGSSEDSIASKPDSIKRAVKESREIPLMVGAGIKRGVDVETSLKLGAKAIGLASGVVLSKDPKKELMELAQAFRVYNS
jgi:triosephosphate isomerase